MTTQLGMLYMNTYPQSALKNLVVGGEKLLPTAKTNIRLFNAYGPTEFTVASTCGVVNQDVDGDIPIGRPVANSYSLVCDERGHLVPRGVVGELCHVGRQIAEGYWRKPEQTAKAFVPCRYFEGATMYRTGDLVCYNTDGLLEYVGRKDHQVKLRGFRIELGEIEAVAARYDGVESAAAAVDNNSLVLYYASENQIDEAALRSALAQSLAEYMVPNIFVRLGEMPLTSNGKIDRRKLPKVDKKQTEEIVAPEGENEKMLFDMASE